MKQGMRVLRTGEACSQHPNFVALDYLTLGILDATMDNINQMPLCVRRDFSPG